LEEREAKVSLRVGFWMTRVVPANNKRANTIAILVFISLL